MKDIGECAGKIWKLLDMNGAAPLNLLMKETGLSTPDIHRAVGWLAREDKIMFVEKNKGSLLQLKRAENP